MKCIHLARKVDEKVFQFLFVHVFSIPELLERLVAEKFRGFLTRYLTTEFLLNNRKLMSKYHFYVVMPSLMTTMQPKSV